MRGLEVGLRHRWDVDRDQARGRLLQDTLGISVGRPTDEPAGRIGRVAGHADRLETGPAHEQRVVVVRPERTATTRGDRLEIVGRRPAAPAVDVPAVAFEPRRGIGQDEVGGPDALQTVGQRRGIGQVDLARRGGGTREVEMCVGETGDRDLVGLERDPFRERVGARLEIDLRTRERHPPVADPDRLDPAEPVVTGERRDPARDQGVERHGVRVVGRRGAPPARPGRDRPRAREPERPWP